MSNSIFPALPGLTWDVKRSPIYNTRVQRSVGGKEVRGAFYANPIWSYKLSYEVLRDGTGANESALAELQTIQAFFLQRQGSFDSFLWADPNDNAVTAQGFGVGDNTTVAFQLQRSYLGVNQQDYWSGLKTSQYTTPRTNNLLYSQDFSNAAWAKIAGGTGTIPVVTPNYALAPDGTPTADRIQFVLGAGLTSGDYSIVRQSLVGGAAAGTRSFWVKSNTGANQAVEIHTGSTDTAEYTVTPSWKQIFLNEVQSFAVYAGLGKRGNTVGAQTTADILVWQAQAESSTAPTPAIPTTTAAVTVTPNYWPKGGDGFEPVYNLNPATALQVFRNDWQGNQLMYQTARTNLILQSSNYAASWTPTGSPTITANATTAPDGTVTASNWARTTTAASYEYQAVTKAASALPYTISNFAKQNTGRYLAMRLQGTYPARADVIFDLQTGTISVAASVSSGFSNASASITPMPNGFYRCSLSATSDTAAIIAHLWAFNSNATYVDNTDSSATSSGYAWGAQLEAGSTLTSYIPTTTVAVTLTDITVSTSGLVTFTNAPLTGAVLTWTGAYYWRVRFAQDQADFNNFMQGLWDLQAVELVSLK